MTRIFKDLDEDPHKDPHEDPQRSLKILERFSPGMVYDFQLKTFFLSIENYMVNMSVNGVVQAQNKCERYIRALNISH